MIDNWAEFVERFAPLVYASAWRFLKHRQEAEDVTQDVFIIAWTQRSEHVQNMGGWLRHMAVCRALDRIRRRRPVVSSDLEFVPTADNSSSSMEFTELEQLVRTAVAALPEHQAAVFALRHFEEMPNQEIADHLKISPSAVSSALYAARRTLTGVLTPIIQGDVK